MAVMVLRAVLVHCVNGFGSKAAERILETKNKSVMSREL